MTHRKWLKVENGDVPGALSGFLKTLVEAGLVDTLLAPCRPPIGEGIVPALIQDREMLARSDLLAPVMPGNMATLVSRLTVTETGRRLGVVLRPCELRALVELTKLHQINLNGVTTIGIDCLGTYEVTDYIEMQRAGQRPETIWRGAGEGEPAVVEGYQVRTACQMCEHPVPEAANVRIGLIGLRDAGRLLIESDVPLDFSILEENGDASARPQAVTKLIERRVAARERILGAWREQVSDISQLVAHLSTCVRCHNCMVACPICYCKECIFRTPTFDHASEQYFRWAERKGALRMPADTLLFHLTRLNHMATSCVGCGMCDSACPSHLPIATLFRAVAQHVQALFDYEAGRSLDEEVPLATFREDELRDQA